MSLSRRRWIGAMFALGAAGAALMTPLRAFATAAKAGFDALTTDAAIAAIVGDQPLEESDAITFKIPDIAENGAVVPVTVSTDIPDVRAISILVDGNPNPLAATFVITPDSFADVSTRVKMGKSSEVRVLVQTAEKTFTTAKEVKVTIGGCGG
jgi:sulfur-oxidizing protein SoxY